jgi:hypothetical protein
MTNPYVRLDRNSAVVVPATGLKHDPVTDTSAAFIALAILRYACASSSHKAR